MTNDRGELVKSADSSVPVEITGLDDVPTGGDIFSTLFLMNVWVVSW